MKHGSLFSGIGGFDLAAEWMGWENMFHCEWNEFGQKVLKYYWPNAISYGDITKTDFSIWRGRIDILTGGFPCQPYSLAGKRKGKEDERHLWPEMLRAIREIQPRWVVGENVSGLISWDGGLVFNEVQTDLEAQGYEVQAYVLPACAVNAPHRRDRVWFVAYSGCLNKGCENKSERASSNITGCCSYEHRGGKTYCVSSKTTSYSNSNGLNRSDCEYEKQSSKRGINALSNIEQMGGDVADTESKQGKRPELSEQSEVGGQEQRQLRGVCSESSTPNAGSGRVEGHGRGGENTGVFTTESNQNNSKGQPTLGWEKFPTQPPICGGDDGLPRELDSITFPKWRNESIKAYGNAVVPQVVLQIFKAIEQFENELLKLKL